MTGLEPATTRTPYVYATNCATSRFIFLQPQKYNLFLNLQNKLTKIFLKVAYLTDC